jgi:uncharacterized membrane protein
MTRKIKTDKRLFFRLDAHYRLMISLITAAIAFLCFRHIYSVPATILLVWIAFALPIIIMDWIIILSSHPREVRKIAKLQDSSRTFLFLFVISASIISLGAIIFLLESTKGHTGGSVTSHILLAMASVIVSWWLVHTVFTLRYAHLYYDTDTDDGDLKPYGGLNFPQNEHTGASEEPDYLDFVYFSFVIGMTFQVSDVEISERDIRRMTLLHALISFAFNTAIVALSINIISSLI